MKQGKKLGVVLIAVCMVLSLFSGVVSTAAPDAELTGQKAAVCTIRKNKKSGKYYYYNKNGNVSKTKGWKKNAGGQYTYYVGKNGYVTAKACSGKKYQTWNNKKKKFENAGTTGKYKIKKLKGRYFYLDGKGKLSKKQGWKKDKNGKKVYYITKDGIPVSDKTIKITNFYYTFDQFGSLVTYKKKDGKIVRSDNGKAVNKEGAYKIGSTIYYCTKDGKYKTSGTVTIGKTKYTVGKDGKCTEKADPPTTEETTTEKSTTEEATTEKPVDEHVHQWSPLDEDGNDLGKSEVINHKAKTEKKDVKVADEWTEWRPSEDEKAVCLICVWAKAPKDGEQWEDENGDGKWSAQVEGRYYFKDYCFDTLAELQKHESDVHNNTSKPTYNYIYTPIHHPAQYETRDVITEEAWDEWYEYWRCTVCGEKMTVRVIKGKTTKGEEKELHIPSDSGEIYTRFGSKYLVVTKNKPFLGGIPDPKVKITARDSMKKYGFSYVGDLKDCNGELSSDYLLLLKDHKIDY